MSKHRILEITQSVVLSAVMLVLIFAGSSSVLAAGSLPAVYKENASTVSIEVDPRVELIGIVFRLAGNPEYNSGTLRPYVKAIEKHFGNFDNDPVVKMAAELRYKRSMSCDGPMSLAVHIDRNYRLRKTGKKWPSTLDYRWEKQETREFLEKLRTFAAVTKFNEFFKDQGPIYKQGIEPCKKIMGQKKVPVDQSGSKVEKILSTDTGEWMSDFFGTDCKAGELKLVLGFVNGLANYGPRFESGDTREKYAIIGMRPFDPANTVIFLPQQVGLVAHEFCHSFTNPVVEKYMKHLQPAGEKLFAAHEGAMRKGGYQKWESVMYETAVRACVVSYIRQSVVNPGYLDYYLKDQARGGFVWIEDMGDLLRNYESSRNEYPTFESFFSEFIKRLNSYTAQAKL